jgi:hypothetical protein
MRGTQAVLGFVKSTVCTNRLMNFGNFGKILPKPHAINYDSLPQESRLILFFAPENGNSRTHSHSFLEEPGPIAFRNIQTKFTKCLALYF